MGSHQGCPYNVTPVKPDLRNQRSRIGVLISRGLARERVTLWCGRLARSGRSVPLLHGQSLS